MKGEIKQGRDVNASQMTATCVNNKNMSGDKFTHKNYIQARSLPAFHVLSRQHVVEVRAPQAQNLFKEIDVDSQHNEEEGRIYWPSYKLV